MQCWPTFFLETEDWLRMLGRWKRCFQPPEASREPLRNLGPRILGLHQGPGAICHALQGSIAHAVTCLDRPAEAIFSHLYKMSIRNGVDTARAEFRRNDWRAGCKIVKHLEIASRTAFHGIETELDSTEQRYFFGIVNAPHQPHVRGNGAIGESLANAPHDHECRIGQVGSGLQYPLDSCQIGAMPAPHEHGQFPSSESEAIAKISASR